jgi:tryptophan-rich sensory protein
MNILPLVVISLSVISVAFLGNIFTVVGDGSWYELLIQPSWTPPDAVFGPVWTTLYFLIILAVSRVWYQLKESPRRAEILGLFVLNGVLNVLWTYSFFTMQSLLAGMIVIILLEISILLLIALCWKPLRTAAWLLVPYALWVGYAASLNIGFYLLNGIAYG